MAFRMLLAAALAAFAAWPARAAPAPTLAVASIDDLDVPDRVYDADADAGRAVDAALARAKAEHKLVLIDLGGDWCADCRILSAVMALPAMRPFLAAHYEIVLVDVGRLNRNLAIPARFGISAKLPGAPLVLVAAPDGHLLNAGHVEALVDARKMTPQAIADWLASWTS